MIVDTSAVVAIALNESDADQMVTALKRATDSRMSAATYLECGIVLDRRPDSEVQYSLDVLLSASRITIVSVTAAQAQLARRAYETFGRGSGHPAQLNFGDCFPYALAFETRLPLLYKGNDFVQTGIRSALPSP